MLPESPTDLFPIVHGWDFGAEAAIWKTSTLGHAHPHRPHTTNPLKTRELEAIFGRAFRRLDLTEIGNGRTVSEQIAVIAAIPPQSAQNRRGLGTPAHPRTAVGFFSQQEDT